MIKKLNKKEVEKKKIDQLNQSKVIFISKLNLLIVLFYFLLLIFYNLIYF